MNFERERQERRQPITTDRDLYQRLEKPVNNIEEAAELNTNIVDLYVENKLSRSQLARYSINLAYKADKLANTKSEEWGRGEFIDVENKFALARDDIKHARDIAKECRNRAVKVIY